jgi:hypothetical protein
MKKNVVVAVAALIFLAAGVGWAFLESSKPLPGQDVLQPGREHKPVGTALTFNSNPPTSGDHYDAWITKGFYNEPREDGYLVHSLEHGYIIMWYDCEAKKSSMIQTAYAQESSMSATQSATQPVRAMTSAGEGTPSLSLDQMPQAFRDGSCDSLKNELRTLYEANKFKMIVLPRVGMGNPVTLTSWGKILRLQNTHKDEMTRFIDSYRDRGPERTLEP